MVDHTEHIAEWTNLDVYCNSVLNNIGIWRDFISQKTFERFNDDAIENALNRIQTSVLALKNRYALDLVSSLDIASVSGFPLRPAISELEDEHELLIQKQRQVIVPSKTLRKELIGQLESGRDINYAFLEKIGKVISQELISENEPIRLFSFRGISRVETGNGSRAYVCLWDRYNYHSFPVLYAMLFECNDHGELTSDLMEEIGAVLREETSQMPKLSDLGKNLDLAVAVVSPKWIGRIIFGPIFISGITHADQPLQVALDRMDKGNYASRIIYEYVVSGEPEQMTSLFDSKGRRINYTQKFATRYGDDECESRGVTALEKYLFAPHEAVRMLDKEYLKKINHSIEMI